MFALFLLGLASLTCANPLLCIRSPQSCACGGCTPDHPGPTQIPFCEIGDSWASGVAWSTLLGLNNAFDNNKDNCLRINHASAVQLTKDNTWYDSKYLPSLEFQACSGSRLVNMKPQMDSCGKPRFTVMTCGGNNAGFFNIATNCIYQQDSKDYGAAFEDDHNLDHCKGECCKAIKASRDYITDQTWTSGHLPFDAWRTIQDVIDSNAAHQNDKFKLYVTGYAKFWSVARGSEWCNKESFGAFPARQPKLSAELRAAMNDLVQKINDLYANTITQKFDKNRVGFINFDARFEGHRFCEPGSNHNSQYYDDNVYFWNLSPPFATALGGILPGPLPGLGLPPDQPITPISVGTGDLKDGYRMRPFHPKEGGHTMIKDGVTQALKDDKVEGVKS